MRKIIDDNFENFLVDLQKLIQIPSVYEKDDSNFPFGAEIDRALKEMLSIAEGFGFKTFYDPKGYYGYADYGEGDKMIGVLGHLDAVPSGDAKHWNNPPFQVTIKDGKAYGRGVQDDKGPTLTAMYAFKALIDSGVQINKKVRFIFGTDEENLWRCINRYNEIEQIPDYGFTPDANFPLIYAEKGLLQVDLLAKSESGLVFSGGDAYNSVPSSITYTTDQADALAQALDSLGFEYAREADAITVAGHSAHAKDAEKGVNAISRLLMAMNQVGMKTACSNFVTDLINEDALAKNIFGDCVDEMSGHLKFNIGKISIRPEQEELNIDMRIPVSISKEFVLERLTAAASKHGFEIRENDYLRSIYTPLDSPLVKSLLGAYQEVTGDTESEPISSGGATYARAMDNCVAFGAAFPHSEETEHQPNEYATIEDMKTAMEVYYRAFENLLAL